MKTSGYILWALVAVIAYPALSHAGFLTPDIRINKGVSPGTVISGSPSISSLSDGHVYIVWNDTRNGQQDIFFNYSTDYGVTWQPNDIRIDTDDLAGANNSIIPEICSLSDSHVYIVWQDDRDGNDDIYFNVSTDYGITWQASAVRRLDTDSAGVASSTGPKIECSDDGHVYVSWTEDRNGEKDIYFNVSSDYGNTWLASDIRLDTGDSPGASYSTALDMCSTGDGHVYVVWHDGRDTGLTFGDIYLNVSNDYGASWQTPDTRIDMGNAPGASYATYPTISCQDDGHVYVTWEDDRNGTYHDILLNLSSDYGANWLASPVRVDTGDTAGVNDSSIPWIDSTSDGHVYVIWLDERFGTENTLLFNTSSDYGSTWSSNPTVLSENPGSQNVNWSQIASTDTGAVYVTWNESVFNPGNLLFRRSLDYGQSWLPSPVYADTGDTTGTASLSPYISVNSDRAYITYADRRNSFDYPDVYFNVWEEGAQQAIPILKKEVYLVLFATLLIVLIFVIKKGSKQITVGN